MSIYPQKITGYYRNIKDCVLLLLLSIYFGGSWLRWERGTHYPNQALYIDLPGRRGYFFGIEIWPDETYYLTGALIMAALGLFFFTSLFGRLWCGYTCPHTVFVDLFVKIEHFFQGDRNQRMRLDQSPMTREKLTKKISTHLAWLLLSFAFAFGWVAYFYDAPTLFYDTLHANLSGTAVIWLTGIMLVTYILGGFARQRVCIYMCPYGRFQSAMLDNDTTIVTYHDWRGEPRSNSNNTEKHGDCINCHKCVVVCPMGIDIRNGLQMACIGCGLCVDACNSVMEKIGSPLGLIAYDSANSTIAKKQGAKTTHPIFKIKTIIFAMIFFTVGSIMLSSLAFKKEITTSIIRSRGALFTMMPSGQIRNTYEVKITNRTLNDKKLLLTVTNLPQASFYIQNISGSYVTSYPIVIPANAEFDNNVFVQAPILDAYVQATQNITFTLVDLANNNTINSNTTFITK